VKRLFLCCYDYGMGGMWVHILARAPNEIGAKYPSLTVVHHRPIWMTDEREPGAEMTFDLEDAPTGWLTNLAHPEKGK